MASTRASTQTHTGHYGRTENSTQPTQSQMPDWSEFHAQQGTKVIDITNSLPDLQPSFTLDLGQLTGRLVCVASVWLLEFRDSHGNRVDDRYLTITALGEERFPVPPNGPNCPVWYLSDEQRYELKYGNIVKTISFPRSPQVD